MNREDALAQALCLLDTFAGEGVGHVYGNGQQIFADDVCVELIAALELSGDPGWWREAAAMLAKPTTPERAMVLEEAARVADELEAWADMDEQYGRKARAENAYAAVKVLRAYAALSASPTEVGEHDGRGHGKDIWRD